MPARRGGFGATLRPFGGGALNLEAAYEIGDLTPTPDPPMPAAPPPLEYGGSWGVPDPTIPIMGQTPVPAGAVGEGGAALPAWQPVREQDITNLDRYIGNLTESGTDPAKLATYTARREEYLGRGTPIEDYSGEIAAVDRYLGNLYAVPNPTPEQRAKIASYEARRADYASR